MQLITETIKYCRKDVQIEKEKLVEPEENTINNHLSWNLCLIRRIFISFYVSTAAIKVCAFRIQTD